MREIIIRLKDKSGNDIIVVQIAGLIARRIVCETDNGQELNQGDRIGMIRFGSRADVYYENYEPLVKVGKKQFLVKLYWLKNKNGTAKK